MDILNLTQHNSTTAQKEAGVVDVPERFKKDLKDLLTFHQVPSKEELYKRASKVSALASDSALELGTPLMGWGVMIGGAPFFMSSLEHIFRTGAVKPKKVLYAFSVRESVEKEKEDGTVEKIMVFNHKGFVEAPKY